MDRLRGWVQTLTQQQRILLLVIFMGVVYFIWSSLWESYYSESKSILEGQLKTLTQKVETLNISRAKIKNLENDPNTLATKKRLQEVYQQLQAVSRQIVSSKQMLDQLQGVFSNDGSISFSRVENINAVPFSLEAPGKEPNRNAQQAVAPEKIAGSPFFKHNFSLTFDASFFSTEQYIEQLQKLPGQLYFDSINYEVINYPIATVILKVHTISPDEGLIDA